MDPMATGLLPICLGEATKFGRFLLDSDKSYRGMFVLGVQTDSGDSEGSVIRTTDTQNLSLSSIELAVNRFVGDIEQIPPMYSAIKQGGQPLYKLARKGIEVDRAKRRVRVYHYKITGWSMGSPSKLEVDVCCSKGTYVRSLAEELGSFLGCGAHVGRLNRYSIGHLNEKQATSLDEVEKISKNRGEDTLDKLLLPIDAGISGYPKAKLGDVAAKVLGQGQAVLLPESFNTAQEGDIVRVFDHEDEFLGVAQMKKGGLLAPKRLVVHQS